MAAALLRRTTGLCCVHRQLCRAVWRPQAALFSSKPSDRKQPRRTHIKKAKPQPPLDVSKLLEQLFSQRRPGGKAQPTKPPSTSSVILSSSNVSTTSASSPTTIEIETKAETVTVDPSSVPSAAVEPTVESPVEPFLSRVETPDIRAAAGGRPLEPTVDVTATAQLLANFSYITQEPLIETTVEHPVETLETRAVVVEGPLEPPVDATVDTAEQEVETNSTDLGLAEEPLIETTVKRPVETVETKAAVVEGPLEPTVDTTVDTAEQEEETSSTDSGLVNLSRTEEPLIKTTVETIETLETGVAVVEGPLEPPVDAKVERAEQEVEINTTDSGLHLSDTEEPLIETTVEPAVEASSGNESTIESIVNVGVNGSEEVTGSVSEATDAEEAVTQAAILVSDQRWRQTDLEARNESGDQGDLKAMSLEVQTSLGSLESLNETRAEAVSGERKLEAEDLPEGDASFEDLLVDNLRDQTQDLVGPEVKRENSSDDFDPVQRLFLDKIREYRDMSRLNGGHLQTDPGYERYVSEETAKLQRLYGGGDLSNFPQFTFTELKMDEDSK